MQFSFETEVIHWRGPAPFFFAPVPERHVADITSAARQVSYGWGMIPVSIEIGEVAFTTSLFPKNGGYLLPLKDAVRRKTGVTVGDTVAVHMTLQPR
jgi:hypothetical protein